MRLLVPSQRCFLVPAPCVPALCVVGQGNQRDPCAISVLFLYFFVPLASWTEVFVPYCAVPVWHTSNSEEMMACRTRRPGYYIEF